MRKTPPHTLARFLPAHLLGSAILLSLPVIGQTGPASDDDFVELPVFVVQTSGDRGYLATNAISGTSLNMPIRDLPMPLEVINRELIDDLQANDMKEALAYSSGVFTQSFQSGSGANQSGSQEQSPSTAANVNNPFTNTISIRGYAVPNQQRLGFRVGSIAVGEGFSTVLGGITDTSNVQRMEVVRGPASLLYGVNVLSGVVNILPNEPLMEPRFRAQATVGSNEYYRGTAEFTGPILKDRLAFRVMATRQDSGDWTDHRKNELEYYVGQLKWYPVRGTEIFGEIQYSDSTARGIGSQFFVDTLFGGEIANNPPNLRNFRNEFFEHIQYGNTMPDSFMARNPDDPNDVWLIYKETPLVPQENARLGDGYRISGPDTYFTREELNALLLVRSTPFQNFNVEFGGYYTRVRQETFDVNMGVFTNSDGRSAPTSAQVNSRAPSPIEQSLGRLPLNLWIHNPEVLRIFDGTLPAPLGAGNSRFYPLDQAVGFQVTEADFPNRPVGSVLSSVTSGGLGEVFIVPDERERNRDGGNPAGNNWNNKVARYSWQKRPTTSDSIQLRGRAAYSFEADLPSYLGGPSRHIFTGGGQFTRDEISIVTGNPTILNTVTTGPWDRTATGSQFPALGEDPYIIRDSVFDYSPIRYQGETLAIPGAVTFNRDRLGSALYNDGLDNGFRITRSGWRDVTAYYRGAYAIYQGHLWRERITFIGGLRHDAYQIREAEQLRVLDGRPSRDPADNTTVTNVYQGSGGTQGIIPGYSVTPFLVGTGDRAFTQDQWIAGVPDSFNEEIARQMDLLREGLGPAGTSRTLFPESQTFNTKTAGINMRLTDDFSAYLLYAEGVFPNQGQRDGLDRPIAAETTSSREIGIKFDLFDRRISGTISLFQIDRNNATWNFPAAPSPRRWLGGRLGLAPEVFELENLPSSLAHTFDARSYLTGDGPETRIAGIDADRYQRRSYGVSEDFLNAVWQERLNQDFPDTTSQSILVREGLGFLVGNSLAFPGDPQFENRGRNARFFWVDVERDLVAGKHVTADGIDLGLLVKEAFERAMAATDYDGSPIAWTQEDTTVREGVGNNPSNRTGDLVTFSERAIGVDGQIIFSPLPNYQIITTFSHQRREVTGGGFNFVPLIDPISGERIPGTQFDQWVYVLGAESFDDVTDPTTHNGLGVDGTDLSFVPRWNFSLWNKYTFVEGPLEGLDLLGGFRYFGSAPTSVAIGVGNASDNRFPTPPTKERYVFDLGMNYGWDWGRSSWRVGLKVDNVLDDRVGENQVTYIDPIDPSVTHTRRSRVVYAPRTWRFTVSVSY